MDGESIELICEPEVVHTHPSSRLHLPCISPVPPLYLPCTSPNPNQVIHKDPSSLALTLHYTLRVDTGLALPSARALLDESLLAKVGVRARLLAKVVVRASTRVVVVVGH